MTFHKPGTTVLVVENMPEMHASFTTSWWRRHSKELAEPTRRGVEWLLLEVAAVVYVLNVTKSAVRERLRMVSPAPQEILPFAAGLVAVMALLGLLL